MTIDYDALDDHIDVEIANWTRKVGKKVMSLKDKTLGQYLRPKILLWIERAQDKR